MNLGQLQSLTQQARIIMVGCHHNNPVTMHSREGKLAFLGARVRALCVNVSVARDNQLTPSPHAYNRHIKACLTVPYQFHGQLLIHASNKRAQIRRCKPGAQRLEITLKCSLTSNKPPPRERITLEHTYMHQVRQSNIPI